MTLEPIRPRRSVLYVPATNARAIDKARRLPCDAVILDLEDAVAPEQKAEARAAAVAAVQAGGFGHREIIVRVNALDTEWGEADLAGLQHSPVHAILAPKIRTANDVLRYSKALSPVTPSIPLWAMVETARCVLKLDEIGATAPHSGLTCLVLGTNDLAKELRMQLDTTRTPLAGILGLTLAAARAHGLGVLDGVYNMLADEAGFEAQCQQGRAYGFDGKTLIHPRQIDPCNEIFTPSAEAIAWARQVRDAFQHPANRSKAVLALGGVLVERLHLAEAERLLALQAALLGRRAVGEQF